MIVGINGMTEDINSQKPYFDCLSPYHQRLCQQIMPQWSKILQKYSNYVDLSSEEFTDNCLDISRSSYCLVGEAHHFTDGYYYNTTVTDFCKTCEIASIALLESNQIIFVEKLKAFLDHFISYHDCRIEIPLPEIKASRRLMILPEITVGRTA